MDKEDIINLMKKPRFRKFVEEELDVISYILAQFRDLWEALSGYTDEEFEAMMCMNGDERYNLNNLLSCEDIFDKRFNFLMGLRDNIHEVQNIKKPFDLEKDALIGIIAMKLCGKCDKFSF